VIEKAGHHPIRSITSAVITKGRDNRAATPAQARNFLDAMRGLFKWAKEAKHVAIDPTIDVKNPKRRKGPGFPVWSEGDAVTLGRQHVRDGITPRTEKSQGKMIVSVPILPILQRTLPVLPENSHSSAARTASR